MTDENREKEDLLDMVKKEIKRNNDISISLAQIAINDILSEDETLRKEFLEKVDDKNDE